LEYHYIFNHSLRNACAHRPTIASSHVHAYTHTRARTHARMYAREYAHMQPYDHTTNSDTYLWGSRGDAHCGYDLGKDNYNPNIHRADNNGGRGGRNAMQWWDHHWVNGEFLTLWMLSMFPWKGRGLFHQPVPNRPAARWIRGRVSVMLASLSQSWLLNR